MPELGPGWVCASVWRCAAHPGQSKFRSLLALDADDLERVVSHWLAERARARAALGEPVVIAVDGGSVRCARTGGEPEGSVTERVRSEQVAVLADG